MSEQTMNYQFDARNYKPDEGIEAVPRGTYRVLITDVEIVPYSDETKPGGRYVIEYTIQEGAYAGKKFTQGFNMWHSNPQVVDISHSQLCAVSHATGVFNIDFNTGGKELMQKQLMASVKVNKEGFNNVTKVAACEGVQAGGAGMPQGMAPVQQQMQAAPQTQPQAQPQMQPAQNLQPVQNQMQPANIQQPNIQAQTQMQPAQQQTLQTPAQNLQPTQQPPQAAPGQTAPWNNPQ